LFQNAVKKKKEEKETPVREGRPEGQRLNREEVPVEGKEDRGAER